MSAVRKTSKPENEITVKAPWGNIAALSWGSPSCPPVLLCHGRLDACSSFRPLVSLLPSSFYYVSIDLPGNGRSDHLPSGVRYSVADLVSAIMSTVRHFNWRSIIYIGHSLGAPIGKLFDIAFPGYISRMVFLDPIPAYHSWPSTPQSLHDWYHRYYAYYEEDKYAKHNGGAESAPKYTYEKALQMTMTSRNLSKEATAHVLERCLDPAEDGLYRFTFDQRMKEVTLLPLPPESLHEIYTTTDTPTLCILAKRIVDHGLYRLVPFATDKTKWPNRNYEVKIVDGWHDVHISNPELMADDVAKFLMADIKGKL